mgnify:CR=1 FL=1
MVTTSQRCPRCSSSNLVVESDQYSKRVICRICNFSREVVNPAIEEFNREIEVEMIRRFGPRRYKYYDRRWVYRSREKASIPRACLPASYNYQYDYWEMPGDLPGPANDSSHLQVSPRWSNYQMDLAFVHWPPAGSYRSSTRRSRWNSLRQNSRN